MVFLKKFPLSLNQLVSLESPSVITKIESLDSNQNEPALALSLETQSAPSMEHGNWEIHLFFGRKILSSDFQNYFQAMFPRVKDAWRL